MKLSPYKIAVFVLVFSAIQFALMFVQILFSWSAGFEVYFNFINYSWYEWVFQLLYWIISLCLGIIAGIESSKD
jgi:hypothetical protein